MSEIGLAHRFCDYVWESSRISNTCKRILTGPTFCTIQKQRRFISIFSVLIVARVAGLWSIKRIPSGIHRRLRLNSQSCRKSRSWTMSHTLSPTRLSYRSWNRGTPSHLLPSLPDNQSMLSAHIDSILTLAEPFCVNAPNTYDFSRQDVTARVKALIPTMLRHRLTPPPKETYSLHRKLSGAFLLCARIGAKVRCKEMFQKIVLKA